MKTSILAFSIAAVFCGAAVRMFWVLATTPRAAVDPNRGDVMRMEAGEAIKATPATGYEEYHATTIVHETAEWVIPFVSTPSFQLAPHRLPAAAGMVGALLMIGAFGWCLFVPRVVSSVSVSSRAERMKSEVRTDAEQREHGGAGPPVPRVRRRSSRSTFLRTLS
jgi:hypothetical protein